MITFTKLGEWGRLGNQLYQYAALKGIANKYNLTPKIPVIENRTWHGQNCLLNEFQINCERLSTTDSIYRTIFEPEPSGYYYNHTLNITDGTNLFGFFQNTKYFNNIESDIKKELIPKEHYLNSAKEYVDSIKKGRKAISIHIRRGDLSDRSTPSIPLYRDNPFDPSSEYGRYLHLALNYFSKKDDFVFLIFTGGSTTGDDKEDIEWASRYFKSDNFIVAASNNPVIDYSRIMSCDYNILSHSSTFGWWAGYVNPNPNKIVIAPSNYHLDYTTHERDGFFPKEWILL